MQKSLRVPQGLLGNGAQVLFPCQASRQHLSGRDYGALEQVPPPVERQPVFGEEKSCLPNLLEPFEGPSKCMEKGKTVDTLCLHFHEASDSLHPRAC